MIFPDPRNPDSNLSTENFKMKNTSLTFEKNEYVLNNRLTADSSQA